MEDLKKIKISVSGKNFYISTDENEKDIDKAVEILNNLIANNRNLVLTEDSKFWVLAALQLAIDLVKSKKLLANWQDGINQVNFLLEKEL